MSSAEPNLQNISRVIHRVLPRVEVPLEFTRRVMPMFFVVSLPSWHRVTPRHIALFYAEVMFLLRRSIPQVGLESRTMLVKSDCMSEVSNMGVGGCEW